MSVLFLSGADKEYDGRTRELENAIKKIANVISMTASEKNIINPSNGYIKFVKSIYVACKNLKGIDCIFADNRKSTIPALLLRRRLNPGILIYDARELYFINESKSIVSKIGCIFEKRIIEKADFVICANYERKKIMQEHYSLKNEVIVFENFRKLEYSDDVDLLSIEQKYSNLFSDDSFKVISTAGCEVERCTLDLIEGIGAINNNVTLILVGCKDDDDRKAVEKYLREHQDLDVKLISRVTQNELKYLVSQSDIGVSMYHKKNMNNKYCSSGKVFEYLYEGIPVVTTDNPPLKALTDKYNVGASLGSIRDSILDVRENYEEYFKNVERFVEMDLLQEAQRRFAEDIKGIIENGTT